ncbi:MAG TPA: glycerol kinase GlpK [Oligoflexia bacterium]|nr:glycerol kinase GlpK [Oligoflexia bacterium]HMP48321.1 glycerol kinase GlpK [Oligoflexia bacterium]
MPYVLAIDQGTSSSRTIIFNELGEIVSITQREISQIHPESGWVEQDPVQIWETQLETINECMHKARLKKSEITCIGITNQRETTILWNKKTGKAVSNAINWQDRRTSSICNELKSKGLENLISEKTGLLIDPYFSATKIAYILETVPEARKLAESGDLAFGTVDSWIIWNLTGGKTYATDTTNASRTMLYNINSLSWDEELLNIFNIPRMILPDVYPSRYLFGEAIIENLKGVPISAVAGDQQAALFGQGCKNAGMAKNTYGTGCFLLMHIGNKFKKSKNRLITTLSANFRNQTEYALEGSVFSAGSSVRWLRDNLNIISNAQNIEDLSRSVPDTGGVYFVPAFSGLGAPYWDSEARGIITGLSGSSTKAHIARACLEAIAYQTLDLTRAMEADSGEKLNELRVDGGASINNFLLQFQADIMDTKVIRPKVSETTALGAALLAGLEARVWKNDKEIDNIWKVDKIFEPRIKNSERENLIDGWKSAVSRSRSKHNQ